jgi:formylglycine-generating enzyme required for sulfatase activity
MSRWFLSYHSPDQALAERLKAAIERKDSASRVFFAPTHLRAGGSWSAQLAQEIADATAFILLVGAAGIGKWQVPEYDDALDRWVNSGQKFPLIVVLLEGQTTPGLPFLRQLHWIVTPDPASEKDIGRIFDAASGSGTRPPDLWRYTSPYRGLEAMEEKDSDYFFGRRRETVEVLNALAASDRLPILIGNSGVGKSSLAQAGVLAALKRQAWPEDGGAPNGWPHVFADSRRWCFLTLRPGTEPVRALVEAFLDTWQLNRTSTEWPTRRAEWVDALLGRKLTLRDLLDQTGRRFVELQRSAPSAFFLYIDQGEELYVRALERERRCFSEILSGGLGESRLRGMMSMRADFFGELQKDQPLDDVSRKIEVKPLREAQLLEVVSRPAELLSARFETEHLNGDIARRAAEESTTDAGALPLLSYLLDDMWSQMTHRGDGVLRLPAQSIDLGLVLVQRADAFLARNPKSEEKLRRIFTLKLATVREDSEPTRRVALRSEFSDEEWRLVSELADHPNRLLVTATPEAREIYAEVAHEAIFRRWEKLREWIAAEREFLAWRSGLEAARRAWQATPDRSKNDALLMGHALAQAQSWHTKRAEDIPAADRAFILQSRKVAQHRILRVQALVAVFVAAMIAGAAAWWQQAWLRERVYVWRNVDTLTAAQEKARKPDDPPFKECTDCPEMVVVPTGSFMMGSPKGQGDDNEHPHHVVTIAQPFAVSKYELTFAEWDACAAQGRCNARVADSFGRGRRPVINVSWDETKDYVAWLSSITGKTYRLLTEAEYEYAARAGTTTAYPWGDNIGKNNANCRGCLEWGDANQTAPVGSFSPNKFGLYDMVGNVWEWTEDCYHDSYQGAPADGSAWTSADCTIRVVIRGGSWSFGPPRSADRRGYSSDIRESDVGFRVARTLLTP